MYKIYIIYKGILNIKIERNKENIKSQITYMISINFKFLYFR